MRKPTLCLDKKEERGEKKEERESEEEVEGGRERRDSSLGCCRCNLWSAAVPSLGCRHLPGTAPPLLHLLFCFIFLKQTPLLLLFFLLSPPLSLYIYISPSLYPPLEMVPVYKRKGKKVKQQGIKKEHCLDSFESYAIWRVT